MEGFCAEWTAGWSLSLAEVGSPAVMMGDRELGSSICRGFPAMARWACWLQHGREGMLNMAVLWWRCSRRWLPLIGLLEEGFGGLMTNDDEGISHSVGGQDFRLVGALSDCGYWLW